MRNLLLLIAFNLLLFGSNEAFSQFFQKRYSFDSKFVNVSNMIKIDSIYYWSASVISGDTIFKSRIFRLDSNGSIIDFVNIGEGDSSMVYSTVQSLTSMIAFNDTIYLYSLKIDPINTRFIPYLSKYDKHLHLLNEFIDSNFISNEIRVVNSQKLGLDTINKRCLLLNISDSTELNSQSYDLRVNMYSLDFDFNLKWKKVINLSNEPTYNSISINNLGDTCYEFCIQESIFSEKFLPHLNYAKTRRILIDTSGINLDVIVEHPEDMFFVGPNRRVLDKVDILQVQTKTRLWNENGLTNYYYQNRYVLNLISPNGSINWEEELTPWWYECYSPFPDLLFLQNRFLIEDSTFYCAYHNPSSIDSINYPDIGHLMFQKRSLTNGSVLWSRPFIYDSTYVPVYLQPLYLIKSIEKDKDGFYLAGSIDYADSSVFNEYLHRGYFVKTNCLGHLYPPICSVSYELMDSMMVSFVSNSIYDGGVIWHFGDSTSEFHNEYDDTIIHTYQHPGWKEVKAIAMGCDGLNDTLSFTFEVKREAGGDGSLNTVNGLFLLAPNPILSGNALNIYIGELPSDQISIRITDSKGRLIRIINGLIKNSVNETVFTASSGVYYVHLVVDDEIIQTQKIVVQ